MGSENVKAWVEVPGGELILTSQDSIDLFNKYCESGTLWEIVSVLFNEYASSSKKSDKILEEQKATQEMLKSLMNQFVNMNRQLPAPVDNLIIESKEPIQVQDLAPKKTIGSLASKLNIMNKFI